MRNETNMLCVFVVHFLVESFLTWFGHSWDRFCDIWGFSNTSFILCTHPENVRLPLLEVLNLQDEARNPRVKMARARKTLSETRAPAGHLDELFFYSLGVHSSPGFLRCICLLDVNVEPIDGISALVDWGLPQQHQRVASHLCDLQVMRRSWEGKNVQWKKGVFDNEKRLKYLFWLFL